MVQSAKFWDRIAHKYATKPIADMPAYENKLAMTRRYMRPNMNVLETGCGTGGTALMHAQYVRHILATDISESMISIAREKARADNINNVTFSCTGMEDLPADAIGFDMVLALNLLHLVDAWQDGIADLANRLKPGGYLVASTVCLEGGPAWMRLVLPVGHCLGFFPKVQFIAESALVQACEDNGLELLESWKPSDKSQSLFTIARKRDPN